MDEQKFQALNKKLRKRQRQIAKANEQQSPSRISEVKSSILKNSSAVQIKPVEEDKNFDRCERCGKTDCEIIKLKEGRFKRLCADCEAKRQEWLVRQREQQIEKIREKRRLKRDNLRSEIERIIPKAYQKARLLHLGTKFKRELLSYDRTTGLVLVGPTGVGKTYALCALLRTFIASGLKCERIGYEELCLMIRNTFKGQSVTSELDILDRYRKADVLLIEDLGSSKPIGTVESDFSLRVIFLILDKRLEWQQPTLITTNKTLSNLRKSFDERIASRLSMMTLLGCGGRDKRLKQ